MDISRFTDAKTGRLIPITTPEKDHAFVPDPLPGNWPFDPNLWPAVVEAKSRLSLLDGTARTLPNPQLLLKPLQRSEALSSSRLEGTYATAQELMLFQMNPKETPTNGAEASNWREVANYNNALLEGYTKLRELPFCLRIVKDMHKTLMAGVRGSERNPGEFRTHQVHIGSNRRYVPPPRDEMVQGMHDLENYLNNGNEDLDPLVKCLMVHYQIEALHPFGDGNGRIGRVVLSLMIYKWCNLEMPWLYLSPFFERYKEEYIDNLFKVSSEGAWSDWIRFCLKGVIEQSTKSVQTCDDLRYLKENMHQRVCDGGSARIHSIIEGLFDMPLVRIVDLAKKNAVRYPTAKTDVNYLIEKQILAPLPNTKVKTFYSPEIFQIAYRETPE